MARVGYEGVKFETENKKSRPKKFRALKPPLLTM
jgi:hypothetical protein